MGQLVPRYAEDAYEDDYGKTKAAAAKVGAV
jgi:hypothetical protein